jgi:hypothetical protein
MFVSTAKPTATVMQSSGIASTGEDNARTNVQSKRHTAVGIIAVSRTKAD